MLQLHNIDTASALLILQHIKGVGPSRLQQLLAHFSSPQQLLMASREQLSALGKGKLLMQLADALVQIQKAGINHPLAIAAIKEIEYCDAQNIQLLCVGDEAFPVLLQETVGSPVLLYLKGDASLLNKPQLAMVGARNASIEGLNNAQHWAKALSDSGLVITSGLAEGIDGAAHLGALEGKSSTIAVVAHGLDSLYPRQHQYLSECILGCGGAIVSEFAIGMQPQREYFPRRNRIISGLSLGVCVVEAAIKSGSLITARYAIEQNRGVFALPSHINNVMAEGCHYLIQQGGELVTKPEHILQYLNIDTLHDGYSAEPEGQAIHRGTGVEELPSELGEDSFLEQIPFSPIHFDSLVAASGLAPHQISVQLTQLEMMGKVVAESGFYRRIVQ